MQYPKFRISVVLLFLVAAFIVLVAQPKQVFVDCFNVALGMAAIAEALHVTNDPKQLVGDIVTPGLAFFAMFAGTALIMLGLFGLLV